MRLARPLAAVLALGLAAADPGQERPSLLPEPAEGPVRDLTPPEFWNAGPLPPAAEPIPEHFYGYDDFADGKVLRQSSNQGIDGLFIQAGLEF